MIHASSWQYCVLCFALVMLTSCGVIEKTEKNAPSSQILSLARPIGPKPQILSPHQVHQLSEVQVDDFIRYFDAPSRSHTPRHRRLADYIVQRVARFDYNADTLTAERVFLTNSGNCLSLALMTTALARVAGVDVRYQLMDDDPVFEFNGNTIAKGVHVRTKLLDPERPQAKEFLATSSGIAIDYFPTGKTRFVSNISEPEYYAMYYRNIAVEALQKDDLNAAYWLSIESLKYAPNHADSLNLLAIVSRRSGNPDIAEQIYLYALERADNKLSLLKNYRLLLRAENRFSEAAEIGLRLERMDDPSPFNWFQLARSVYDDGDYESALSYYTKALEIAPYLHEARLGIANSYYALGRIGQAETALVSAIANANSNRTRQRYKEKLYALRAH